MVKNTTAHKLVHRLVTCQVVHVGTASQYYLQTGTFGKDYHGLVELVHVPPNWEMSSV